MRKKLQKKPGKEDKAGKKKQQIVAEAEDSDEDESDDEDFDQTAVRIFQ